MSEQISNKAPTWDDFCLPFQIEGADVKGQATRLGPVVDHVLSRHDYPEPVARLTGEALILAVLLGVSLKFDGKLSIQIKSDGPVSLLVADYFTPGILRAYAQFDEEKVAEAEKGDGSDVEKMLGEGHFAMIIDQGQDTEQYQGFVPLEGASLAEFAQTYFMQSEQLATSFEVAVAQSFEKHSQAEGGYTWRAGGIMLQHLPSSDAGKKVEPEETPAEIWNRVNILLNTTETHELTDPALSAEELLYRLFHEDGVRVYDARNLDAGCACDEEKVRVMLSNFPKEDLEEILQDGEVVVTCEFCSAEYSFTPDDLAG